MSTATRTRRAAASPRPLLEAMALQVIVVFVGFLSLLAAVLDGHVALAAAGFPVALWTVHVAREHTRRTELDYLARRAAATERDRIVRADAGRACVSDCGRPCSGCCYRSAAVELTRASR